MEQSAYHSLSSLAFDRYFAVMRLAVSEMASMSLRLFAAIRPSRQLDWIMREYRSGSSTSNPSMMLSRVITVSGVIVLWEMAKASRYSKSPASRRILACSVELVFRSCWVR